VTAKETSGLSLLSSAYVLLVVCVFFFLLLLFVLCKLLSLTFAFPLSCSISCSPVPKDRDKYYFKLRQGVHKKVCVTVQQMSNQELVIERWVMGFRNSDVLPFPFLLLYNDCQGLAFKENKKDI